MELRLARNAGHGQRGESHGEESEGRRLRHIHQGHGHAVGEAERASAHRIDADHQIAPDRLPLLNGEGAKFERVLNTGILWDRCGESLVSQKRARSVADDAGDESGNIGGGEAFQTDADVEESANLWRRRKGPRGG